MGSFEDDLRAANLRACDEYASLDLGEKGWEQVWSGLYAIMCDSKRQVRRAFELDPTRSQLYGQFPELLRWACDPQLPISYSPSFREFGVNVFDGGPATQGFSHDPFSGRALPSSVRDAWFKTVETLLGREVGILDELPDLPAELDGEEWWIKRGL